MVDEVEVGFVVGDGDFFFIGVGCDVDDGVVVCGVCGSGIYGGLYGLMSVVGVGGIDVEIGGGWKSGGCEECE